MAYSDYLDDLAASLPCAYWQDDVVEEAASAFKKFCPSRFKVKNIRALPSTSIPYCRWYVEFHSRAGLPDPGEELKSVSKGLMQHKPINAKLISRHLINPDAFAFVYGALACPCESALEF
jgi:hypothetical protein